MVKRMLPQGIFHKEWKKDTVEDVFSFLTNNTFARDKLNETDGRFQNIHYGDILVKYGYILDCSVESVPYINREICIKSCCALLQDGDIVMADTAEDETVGKVIEIDAVGDRRILSGLHTIPMRPKKYLFEHRFLGYYLNSKEYHDQILPFITGIKVSSISRAAIKNTYVRYPSDLDEQKAIAEALSDIDHLIVATEKSLAKKKAIKHGMMQELLTGKRRLPGFTEPWIKVSLGDILKVCHGRSQHLVKNENGKYPILATSGIIGYASDYICDYPSALIGRKGTIDHPMYIDTPFWCIDTLFYTQARHENSAKYIYYLFYTIDWYSLNEASGVPSLNAKKIESIEVHIPGIQEQIAIVNTLSDLDNEIEKQFAYLNKQKKIKQGMMSELLTGRIRLLDRRVTENHAPKPISKSSGHNEQFDDAVMISAIVNAFFSPQYPLGRKKIQKLLYLARRYQNASTDGFLKKAAGPYKPSARYRGGERIAVSSHYIQASQSDKGSIFVPGKEMQTALDYSDQWDFGSVIKWLLQNFKYTKVDNLELIATVDMAICELNAAGHRIDVTTVKAFISHDAQWRDKLKKPFFSDRNIDAAIKKVFALFETDSQQ